VEPSFEDVQGSLEVPITHPIEETKGDLGVEALDEGEHVSEIEEPQIEPPITEFQILQKFEEREEKTPTLEEPYVPSSAQPEHEDVTPTSIEEQEEAPIINEDTSAPIQALHELPKDVDVEAPLGIATTKLVKPEQVEPRFQEVPRSLELPISQPLEETQGDLGVELKLRRKRLEHLKSHVSLLLNNRNIEM
jgi:hypothetical protein